MSSQNPDQSPEQGEGGSPELFRLAVENGLTRLNRAWLEMGTSGFIAGMNVTFGALAAGGVAGAVVSYLGEEASLLARVAGAMVFPIGFIFVVIGRSELFTENFLVPTAAVIARRERMVKLLKLWFCTLLGNFIGAVAVARILSLEYYHGVPSVDTVNHIHHVAEFLVLERDWDASFMSAVFAGWLITLMTWLLLSARDVISRIALIWCVGFMINMNKFNHVIVNSSEVLLAMFTGNESITYSAWIYNNFIPTLLGNMLGGLVFVTLLEYIKVMRAPTRWN